jgi:hypothetical protein
MKIILKLILIVSFISILILGYLGFVPFVSPIMGSTTPKSLGIVFENEDLKSCINKIQPVSENSEIDTYFTSEELTALANSGEWNYPASDIQVKANNDGTIEISGIFLKDQLLPYLEAQKFPDNLSKILTDYIKNFSVNPIFYIKGKGYVDNNKITIRVEQAEIGKLPVSDRLNKEIDTIKGFLESKISLTPNLYINNLNAKEGKIYFKGKLPNIQFKD